MVAPLCFNFPLRAADSSGANSCGLSIVLNFPTTRNGVPVAPGGVWKKLSLDNYEFHSLNHDALVRLRTYDRYGKTYQDFYFESTQDRLQVLEITYIPLNDKKNFRTYSFILKNRWPQRDHALYGKG